MRPLLRFASLCLAVLALARCGDGTGPGFIAGDFSLVEVNGAVPPVLVEATINCDGLISSGYLTLGLDGRYELGAELTTDCTRTGGQVSTQVLGTFGSYTRSGKTISFQVAGGFPITATFENNTITGTIPAGLGLFANDVELTYLEVVP
jgi:hypothetical protein